MHFMLWWSVTFTESIRAMYLLLVVALVLHIKSRNWTKNWVWWQRPGDLEKSIFYHWHHICGQCSMQHMSDKTSGNELSRDIQQVCCTDSVATINEYQIDLPGWYCPVNIVSLGCEINIEIQIISCMFPGKIDGRHYWKCCGGETSFLDFLFMIALCFI